MVAQKAAQLGEGRPTVGHGYLNFYGVHMRSPGQPTDARPDT
ncbi:hypothetical protein OG800_11245 [Streptomyces sp. NBC_00445]